MTFDPVSEGVSIGSPSVPDVAEAVGRVEKLAVLPSLATKASTETTGVASASEAVMSPVAPWGNLLCSLR